MTIQGLFDIVNLSVYILWYVMIGSFTIWNRKELWRAAKGGNGILQLDEAFKLGALYAFLFYANEVIHGNEEFDLYFGIVLIGIVGVVNLGEFDFSSVNVFKKKEEKQENKEDEGWDT